MNLDSVKKFGQKLASIWRVGEARLGRGGIVLVMLTIAVVIACGIYLFATENPWQSGVVEKLNSGSKLTIGDTIEAGFWLGSLINVGLAVMLLATAFWWARPLSRWSEPSRKYALKGSGIVIGRRWFWGLTLLALIAGAYIRAPRLGHSLWNDEEQALRKFTWGDYRPGSADQKTAESEAADAGGELEFFPTKWDRAIFYSVNGNNHVYHTVWAKFLHEIWAGVTEPDPPRFHEPIIRLEPFVSGLLMLVALAVWLKVAGFPLAGVVATWLVALHPWVLRYAVEARGYSAMLLFVVLALLFLTLALRTRAWGWWLAYGASQLLYLLCFAGAVIFAVGLNLVAVAVLALQKDRAGLWRWFVSCVLGAMAFLQIMTAAVLRLLNWLQKPHVEPFPINLGFVKDFWAHLTTGEPWTGPDPALHFGIDAMRLADESVVWYAGFFYVLPALFVLGLAAAWWKSGAARLLFGALGIVVCIIVGNSIRSEMPFYGWYALYFVVGFVVALAFVPEAVATGLQRFRRRESPESNRIFTVMTAALVVIFFGWLGSPGLIRIRNHDRHPMRQAVEAVRGEAPAISRSHDTVLTGAAGSGANQLRSYDPRVEWIKSVEDLDALIARARAEQKPLVIYVCGQQPLKAAAPELFARFADVSQFRPGPYLPGLEEFWSFQIFHFIP